jgi:hypothetical protein
VKRGSDPSVYFVRRADGEGPVKIGCSQSPLTRLAQLTYWAPYPLVLVASVPGDEQLERRFHAKFAADHSHSEWFQPSQELSRVVAAVAAGEFDFDSLPAPVRLLPINRRERTADEREMVRLTQRLRWVRAWRYPLPPEVSAVEYGYMAGPEHGARRLSVLRTFIADHYEDARAHGRARKMAA